jgi:type IV secretion system protein VirD4
LAAGLREILCNFSVVCLNASIFAGAGSFKSTSAASTLLTWTGSVVVLDPSCELGPILAGAREKIGHTVHQLGLRGVTGFNVLDWIDIDSPLATTNVLSVVGWVCGDGPAGGDGRKDKGSEFFEARGRAMVACLLSHMLWDPAMPPELKTLRTLRAGIATPEKDMRKLLEGVHKDSLSPLARARPRGHADGPDGGDIFRRLRERGRKLANPAFASIVSGDTFKSIDLLGGKMSVFLQIRSRRCSRRLPSAAS